MKIQAGATSTSQNDSAETNEGLSMMKHATWTAQQHGIWSGAPQPATAL